MGKQSKMDAGALALQLTVSPRPCPGWLISPRTRLASLKYMQIKTDNVHYHSGPRDRASVTRGHSRETEVLCFSHPTSALSLHISTFGMGWEGKKR